MPFAVTPELLAAWQLQPRPKATPADLADLEAQLGLPLPAPYAEFVTQFGFVLFDQGQPARNQFEARYQRPGQVEVRRGSVVYLLQPERLVQSYRNLTEPEDPDDETLPAFPKNYLPVAGDAGQGKLLLETGPEPGRVWYWEAREWRWGTEDNTELGFVAQDFYDFINQLQPAVP